MLLAAALLLLFISVWSVIPAPNLALFPLSLGAPEFSPYLVGAGVLLALISWRKPAVLLACTLSVACSITPWYSLMSSRRGRAAAFLAALPEAPLTPDARARPIRIQPDVPYP